MLNILKKFFLITSLIFYALTLYSFFYANSTIFIIFFVLHSIAILIFALITVTGKEDNSEEINEYIERIQNIKAQWRDETDSLKKELSKKSDSSTTLEEQVVADNLKIVELNETIESLKTKLAEAADAVSSDMINVETNLSEDISVIPPFLPERATTSTVNIIDVAKSVANEYHDPAVKAGVSVTISSTEDSLLVKMDHNLVRTLFRNIIDNSIKYMNRHGSLIITISSIGDEVFVVCKDNGDGLSVDETKHIFELNYQGSNRISGNGLGLFQAKAIVTYYGGTIYAKSNNGTGMGIYIQLPNT